jgi:CDP-diacylglycerol---serine O-phosphatidyltransferase
MQDSEVMGFWNYFAFLVPVFAAFRLAKFNIDTRQSYYFIGLPTPAATVFVISFPLILFVDGFEAAGLLFYNPIFLAVISVFLSIMMIAPIPLLSLKASKGKKPSKLIWLLGGLGIVSFSFFHFLALPIVILLYLFLSLLFFKPHEVQS